MASGPHLERRVLDLLDRGDGEQRALRNDVLAVTMVMLAAAAITLTWPGSLFHDAVETTVGLFFH